MKALYLETSALAQAYLEDQPDVLAALHSARRGCRVFTSALTVVEVRRALLRAEREREVSAAEAARALRAVLRLLQHVDVLPLATPVLARTGAWSFIARGVPSRRVASPLLSSAAGAVQRLS